jgi:hypothetical protein
MRRRGGILLEVSIATALAAVVMIAVSQLLAVAAKQERTIDWRRLAAQEAANSLERVLTSPWDDVTPERLKAWSLSTDAAERLPAGTLTWEVELTPETPAAKRITAEVSWSHGAGDRERVRLSAWRFQPEKRP